MDCFEGKKPVRDAEAVEADSAPANDPVDAGDAETVALYDEVDFFEGKNTVRDAEAVEADSAPTNDPVDAGDARNRCTI